MSESATPQDARRPETDEVHTARAAAPSAPTSWTTWVPSSGAGATQPVPPGPAPGPGPAAEPGSPPGSGAGSALGSGAGSAPGQEEPTRQNSVTYLPAPSGPNWGLVVLGLLFVLVAAGVAANQLAGFQVVSLAEAGPTVLVVAGLLCALVGVVGIIARRR